MSTPPNDDLTRREGEEDRRQRERRAESERRDGLGQRTWDGIERRVTEGRRGSGTERRKHHHRHSHRRWRRFKKTFVTLLVVMGICFVIAFLLTYITGGLPNLVEKIVSKNIEKAIQRTTAEFAEGKFGPEDLKKLGKNVDIDKLKGEALKRLGGWEGDRGEGQAPEDYKGKEDYTKHLSRGDLEKNKDYYKQKYKELMNK